MRLKALELVGFKSFNDRSVLIFPPQGFSVIVGPNGCGKSNIVDAILWALGEMRPTMLRSKTMEDVIFNGTEGVRPSGMAEVSLVFEDAQREGEIRVTRRLYRSGETEYLINRRPCRLKDIRDLFLGTGLGTNTYAVIPQGEVEALITAPPQHLRMLIEEAAGVSKVQEKRKEILKKLETTRQNLERLEDVLAEVQRQANSLRYQAAKARRFIDLRERLRSLEVRELALKASKVQEELREVEVEEEALARELKGLEGERTKLRAEILEGEEELGSLRAQLEELERTRVYLEGEGRRLEEKVKALEGERASAERALRETSRRLRDLRELKAGLIERKGKIQGELERTQREVLEKKGELEALHEALKAAEPRRKALRDRRNLVRRELLEIEAERVRAKNSVNEASQREFSLRIKGEKLKEELEETTRKISQLRGQLEEALRRQEGMSAERAALRGQLEGMADRERALRDSLEGIQRELMALEGEIRALRLQEEMLRGLESSLEGYPEEVKAVLSSPEKFGLGELFTVGQVLEAERGLEAAVEGALGERVKAIVATDLPHALKILEASQGKALVWIPRKRGSEEGDLVSRVTEGRSIGIAPSLLGGIALVDRLPEEPVPGVEYVTRDGLFLDHRGVIWPGRSSGVLERKNLLREIAERLAELGKRRDELEDRRKGTEEELRALKAAKAGLEERVREVEAALAEAGQRVRRIQGELELLERKEAAVRAEREENAQEIAHWLRRLEEERRKLEALEERARDAQALLARVEGELREVEGQLREREAERGRIREEIARLEERLRAMEATLRDLDHQIQRSQGEEGELLGQRGALEDRIKRAEEGLVEAKAALEEIGQRRRALDGERARLEDMVDSALRGLEAKRKALREVEGRWEWAKERASGLRAMAEGLRVELSHLEETLRANHSLGLEEALEVLRREPLGEGYKEEKEGIRQALERLGDVYLGAIQEYEEVGQRLRYLLEQKEDLEESMRSLERSLEEMDRRSREAFLGTFQKVRDIFREFVGRLFDGGRGELVLDGGEDLGVRILIEPKGKRLRSMELLSRGEKSLASIAFILSLFFLKPAPFCIMDEVDSALDEANIDRFIALLEELKDRCQFILITHQRRTIEAAEYVYGVTMETPGISKVLSLRLQ